MTQKYKNLFEKATSLSRNLFKSQNWPRLKENSRLKNLRVTGPFTGATGYDNLTRCFVRALGRNGVRVELHDLCWSNTRLPDAALADFFESHRRRVRTRFHLHFCMPQQVKPSADCVNINYTMFEATRLAPLWVQASLKQDLIIVPTESSRQCWLHSGIPESKIKKCPPGVDFEKFSPKIAPLAAATTEGRAVNDFRLRFLNVAESNSRKNLAGLLRAWISATNKRDDAVLILKTGFYARGSREQFERQLREVEQNLGKRLPEAAPVVLLDEQLSPEEMPRLYTMATHYWSMSHGEGFDLPMLEAAACGLQLIAPDHSAYQEYLNPQIARLLPAREVPVHIPDDAALNAFFAGANWWEPDETAAIELIRGLMNGSIAPTQSARAALLPKYTWDNAARQLSEIIVRSF